MAAACTDDVEIGLSIWTRPEETPAEAAARQSLRKLVVHWWARNLEWEARAWLATVTCPHGDHAPWMIILSILGPVSTSSRCKVLASYTGIYHRNDKKISGMALNFGNSWEDSAKRNNIKFQNWLKG